MLGRRHNQRVGVLVFVEEVVVVGKVERLVDDMVEEVVDTGSRVVVGFVVVDTFGLWGLEKVVVPIGS